jgi:hypothetical protein
VSGAATSSDRITAFATSVIAVLAAVGTLFASHRSINALAIQARGLGYSQQASDQYAYYQSQQVRAAMYQALAAAIPGDPQREARLKKLAGDEQRSSLQVFERAKELEADAKETQVHAQATLRSFELIEITTTFFEISIAFASISALTRVRAALIAAGVLTAIGLVVGVIGYFEVH